MLGEDGEQFWVGVAREALGFHRCNGGGDAEHLGGFGQRHGVVLQNLAVDRLHAEGHLRLVIDEDDLAIGWRQKLELFIGHRCSPVSSSRTVDSRRSEEHTSELQSLMRISYAVFCLKKNK